MGKNGIAKDLCANMSNKAILDECSRILNAVAFNENIVGPYFDFLCSAFGRANYYYEKTHGQKIVSIQKKLTGGRWNTPAFFITRADGTETDFSCTKMFKKNQQRDDVYNALRHAIGPIIIDFCKTFRPFVYNVLNITSISQCDVDHYDRSFKDLAGEWVDLHGGVEALSKYVCPTIDNDSETYFTDVSLIEDFRKFHNANTHLRFLPKAINRSRKNN